MDWGTAQCANAYFHLSVSGDEDISHPSGVRG